MAIHITTAASRWAAVVALELNIGGHVALTPMHLEEKFYIGVLFTIGNAALFIAMLLLVSERFRLMGWLLGAATSVAEFAGFVVSRTIGLPQGYKETWTGAPEDYVGLGCLVVELVFVVLALRITLAIRRSRAHRPVYPEQPAHLAGSATPC